MTAPDPLRYLQVEEEATFAAFDGKVVARISAFVRPWRARLYGAVAAVALFVLCQLAVPLLIRAGIDAAVRGEVGLHRVVVLFAVVLAAWLQRVQATFRRAKDASSIVNAALAENINGIRTVIGARREPVNLAGFETKVATNRDA